MRDPKADRARGALWGLAIGDALGMPTQTLSRDEVIDRYGLVLNGFADAAPDHPIAPGYAAGRVTDDTEQALLLGAALLDGGFDERRWSASLLEWEEKMASSGSLDLLGPSTKRALEALRAGTSSTVAAPRGTTNGAAMRIAPVGIVMSTASLSELVDLVVRVSRVTHASREALAGAAAVAAAVSAGVDALGWTATFALAVRAAKMANSRGAPTGVPDVSARVERAVMRATSCDAESIAEVVVTEFGTGLETHESVPAAFAVVSACRDDPWMACRVSASLGGDSDTIAAITGAIVGAHAGASRFSEASRVVVQRANGLDIDSVASALFEMRGVS